MPKVTVVQVVYNSSKWIPKVFEAIFAQTFTDFNAVAVIAGNRDGSKELLQQKFPQVEIIDPGYNIGFAAGHNLVFERYKSEFFQLVNPDMIMEPNYIEEILRVFSDPKVGAATGKLYQMVLSNEFGVERTKRLDTTGVTIAKSGRARDRGQYETDFGQYDKLVDVDAVSAAGAMYRNEALQNSKLQISSIKSEYFDEDFHSYWEDVDLSWRMSNAGWKNIFAPGAVGYHGRAAGASPGGYLHVVSFIKHHRALPLRIRQLNYKNHLLMYVKNSPYFYPQFFVREFFMFLYIIFFEPDTLSILPSMLKLLPKIWKKRKLIYQ